MDHRSDNHMKRRSAVAGIARAAPSRDSESVGRQADKSNQGQADCSKTIRRHRETEGNFCQALSPLPVTPTRMWLLMSAAGAERGRQNDHSLSYPRMTGLAADRNEERTCCRSAAAYIGATRCYPPDIPTKLGIALLGAASSHPTPWREHQVPCLPLRNGTTMSQLKGNA